MKKITTKLTMIILIMATMLQHTVLANVKSGEALNTDIVAYINNYAIPSYAVNGTTVIVAEDLRNYGFDVQWDGETKTLHIDRSQWNEIAGMSFYENIEPVGSVFCDLYYNDISVYAGDYKFTSYCMNGYTMIPIEELTMFGEVYWEQDIRAIKLWVDGLNVSHYPVKPSSYPTTTLYSKNGNTLVVYQGKEAPYLKEGWYLSKEEAQKEERLKENIAEASKFKVGDRVWTSLFVLNKYGVVTAVDKSNGKVKVRWTKITDGYGYEKVGFEGMLYGLGSEDWENASTLMLQ